MLERIIDMAADELGIDPVEIRKQNFIPPEAFPLSTVTGANYDIGEYAKALDEACRDRRLRRAPAPSRRRGASAATSEQLGIGVSAYVEVTAGGLFQEYGVGRGPRRRQRHRDGRHRRRTARATRPRSR